jgi:hypothetical protein
VVGCSLRTEDFPLLSLVFSAQAALMQSNKPVFRIELVLSEKTAGGDPDNPGMIERLSFLTGFKRLSELSVYKVENDPDKSENPYYYWMKRAIDDVQAKCDAIQDDSFIMDKLLGGKFI